MDKNVLFTIEEWHVIQMNTLTNMYLHVFVYYYSVHKVLLLLICFANLME